MRFGWAMPLIVWGLLASVSGGCGASKPVLGSDSEVKQLGIAYMRFVGQHQNKAPENRKEFEGFLKAMTPAERSAIGVDDPTVIFQSSRDGADIVIRYGIKVPPPEPGKPTVLAYEGIGVNGKRLAVFGTGGVEEISEERLHELVPDAK